MKRKWNLFFIILICALLIYPAFSSAQTKVKPKTQKELIKALPEKYRKWLEEEVVYIISPKEKEVFLSLENDRQRDMFIEAFWKQRDPTPDTPENEFKEEHYRRIKYANEHFGKDSPGPGWRTDMGRIYIILGEPQYTEKYENLYDLYPTVIWFYQGMAEYGLPNAFSVVFYKPNGNGEYQLYSPIKDGPQKLMPHYSGDMTDYAQAYQALTEVERNVANVSLSLIEGEPLVELRPTIASDILLYQRIPNAPIYKVKDTYADKLLHYKDIIEVEYSANYIDSDALASVYRSQDGIYYVHYLIEPKKLSLEKNGENYQTSLEINGIVTDLDNQQVYQFNRRIPLNLTEDQVAKIKDRLMSFQDVFPLVPGKYKLSILLKNFVSKEFTSFETNLNIPEEGLQISPLLLANRLTRSTQYRGLNKAFLLGDWQFVPSPRNDFAVDDTLYVFFQLWGLTPELKQKGILNYDLVRENGEKVKSFSKKIADYSDQNVFYETIPLQGLTPANYLMTVSLVDENGNEILSQKENFFISHLSSLSRSWVMTQPQEGSNSAEIQHALGIQYWNKKEIDRAKKYLEIAYRLDPSQPAYALDFCRLLYAEKQYQNVLAVAAPFVNNQQNYDFLEVLGKSSQALNKYEEAINYYKQYLSHFGTNINILNAIGECYFQLGEYDEALYAWERSLQLEPDQEKIKAQIKTIKEKKPVKK
ncbi:MAG: GWxTD domain-containing protein [Candidatus Aminicenantes bacterium]|nr:GWxTD domain-containing protein [Candidatus Aminicenantes bacterium]